MDDGRSAIKWNIQYLEQLQISQEDYWRPIKAYIEWTHKHYKWGTYATVNRVQRLEEKGMYIRYTSELNNAYTHMLKHR